MAVRGGVAPVTWPEYFGSLAIVAFLLWFAFHIHDNIKACCRERLVCELLDDGAEVGVDRSSSDGAFLAMPLRSGTSAVDADTFPREWTLKRTGPYDQDAA